MRPSRWASFGALAIVTMAGPLHAQKKVAAGYATTPNVSVRLFAAVGTVQVVGWERDSVVVSGTVAADSRVALMAPSSRTLEGMKFFIEAATEQSGREGTLTLHVPRGARVWVKTGSAHIAVSDVDGGLDLNVVGGSIDVRGNPRELRAESMDGAVTVEGAPEWARVKTATGDIVLRGGGQNIGASTISGAIDARDGQTERATLETTTGPIRFGLAVARGASIELETHSGAIDIQLARKTDVEMDAATVTGTIDNAWSRTRPAAGREGRGMTLVTSGGTSSGRIVVRSFKGRIALRGS
jgi:DUF4097 and DUF4098 domain-containing protein YvlB